MTCNIVSIILSSGEMDKLRLPIIILLLVVIAIGVSVFIIRQNTSSSDIKISLPAPSTPIEIYISGEVNNPGRYALTENSIVAEAIEAAGGYTARADRTAINELRTIREGDQIIVYKEGESIQLININTAEPWLLDALPGIGEATAQAIVQYRNENGSFATIEELKAIKGIGDSTFLKIQDKISVR